MVNSSKDGILLQFRRWSRINGLLMVSSRGILVKSFILVNLLYNNEDVIEGINKSEFKNLLLLATQESYFIFNDVLYKQKDGVAMG